MTWLSDDTTLCRCEETSVKSFRDTVAVTGSAGIRSTKLTTRAGLGICQGRICGRNVEALLAALDQRGIGVDRMVREMVRVGHVPPDIREITGPFVRTSLVGDALDESWMSWLGSIEPAEETADVSSLLILRRLVEVGWVDTPAAARLIQLTNEEARGALLRVSHARVDGHPLIELTAGVPEGTEPAWHVTPAARDALLTRSQAEGRLRELPSRTEVARSYASARGRISSTELASLVGASPSNVGGALKALAAEGVLEPSSPAGRGRGFFYRWTGGNQPQ